MSYELVGVGATLYKAGSEIPMHLVADWIEDQQTLVYLGDEQIPAPFYLDRFPAIFKADLPYDEIPDVALVEALVDITVFSFCPIGEDYLDDRPLMEQMVLDNSEREIYGGIVGDTLLRIARQKFAVENQGTVSFVTLWHVTWIVTGSYEEADYELECDYVGRVNMHSLAIMVKMEQAG